jgi:hypothetical protein
MSGCELGRKVVRVSKQWTNSKARLPCATNVTVSVLQHMHYNCAPDWHLHYHHPPPH